MTAINRVDVIYSRLGFVLFNAMREGFLFRRGSILMQCVRYSSFSPFP